MVFQKYLCLLKNNAQINTSIWKYYTKFLELCWKHLLKYLGQKLFETSLPKGAIKKY